MRLKNRIGIVTAAGSGMGRAGAIRFAQEDPDYFKFTVGVLKGKHR